MKPEHGSCEGCGRTLAEIAGWSLGSESWRRAVRARLAAQAPAAPPRDSSP